ANVPTFQPEDCVASTVMFGAVITGGVVSFTVTVNVFDEWLPAASIAVTVTVVVPTANVAPDAFEKLNVTGPTASVAVGAAYVTAPPAAVFPSPVRFALTDVITGAVVSRTVTVKVFVAVFPCPSVAVTVTVFTPRAKVVPEACEYVIVTGPTASVAV